MLASASFWLTTKAIVSTVMIQCEERGEDSGVACKNCGASTAEKWEKTIREGSCLCAVHGCNSNFRCRAEESGLHLSEVVFF